MRRERAWRGAALLCAVLVFGGIAIAEAGPARSRLSHRVRKGDTLELLSAEYYGNRKFAVFIMVANDLTHPRPLKPGEGLRIPTAWPYRTAPRETLADVARQQLGDARRAPFLADFNGLPPATSGLAAGQELMIPFHVSHRAGSDEPLDAIAATFYGDAKKGDLLRRYNFREDGILKSGQRLIVPIIHVRVREEKLPAEDPEARKREAKRRQMTSLVKEALPQARSAWKEGDYDAVKGALADLDPDYLDPEAAAQVGLLLGSAYIAFDDEVSALAQFRRVLDRAPRQTVRADEISPKILRIWEKAGGKVVRP